MERRCSRACGSGRGWHSQFPPTAGACPCGGGRREAQSPRNRRRIRRMASPKSERRQQRRVAQRLRERERVATAQPRAAPVLAPVVPPPTPRGDAARPRRQRPPPLDFRKPRPEAAAASRAERVASGELTLDDTVGMRRELDIERHGMRDERFRYRLSERGPAHRWTKTIDG